MDLSLTCSFIHGVKHFMVSSMGALNTQGGLDLSLPLWSSWSEDTDRQAP